MVTITYEIKLNSQSWLTGPSLQDPACLSYHLLFIPTHTLPFLLLPNQEQYKLAPLTATKLRPQQKHHLPQKGFHDALASVCMTKRLPPPPLTCHAPHSITISFLQCLFHWPVSSFLCPQAPEWWLAQS